MLNDGERAAGLKKNGKESGTEGGICLTDVTAGSTRFKKQKQEKVRPNQVQKG